MEPLSPRVTKSTAVAAIRARFTSESELLKRFEIAKEQANLWDGERDGLREVVKVIPEGQYDDCILSKSTSAAVMYPNATGKHQLGQCLQSTVPSADGGIGIQVYGVGLKTPEEFLDSILHHMQTNKAAALAYLTQTFVGEGITVDNGTLYAMTASEKATIVVLPNASN